ncbi:MAG: alpha/beta fold hydrolase [Bdellovibrionales bacterium]|nr:alpha/beta fold hydrolase [Bdellovibrionales bacterium]
MTGHDTTTNSSFAPWIFIRNKHIQTLLGSRAWPILKTPNKVITLSIDTKRKCHIRLFGNNLSRIAILIHGLGGSGKSRYMLHTAHYLLHKGYDVACVSLPGVEDTSPYLYHAGDHTAFDTIAETFRKSYAEQYWIGFSLGGNMLLRWLSQPKNIQKAVAISPVLDLNESAILLEQNSQRLYQWYFLRSLLALYKNKVRNFPEIFTEYERVLSTKTIRDLDTHLTCPFHGYDGLDSYYGSQSSINTVSQIQNKTLILSSLDDPFQSPDIVKKAQTHAPPSVSFCVSEYGGHVGFFHSPTKGVFYPTWAESFLSSS